MEHKKTTGYKDQARLDKLISVFKRAYGRKEPEIVVRVPGRVNLIGEHIDYCGYGVHPMAIEQDVLVAVAKRPDSRLCLNNLDGSTYGPHMVDLSTAAGLEIRVDGKPDWWSYFLCGVKGVAEELLKGKEDMKGLSILVDGKVPPSAGLSSSSSLVVAAAICTVWANSVKINNSDLADLCARAERHIGTQGGGMDQAIEILAVEGSAKLLEFNPLKARDIPLPPYVSFVVANSLAESNKAAGADYNTRVVECRLATRVMAKLAGVGKWEDMWRLGEFQKQAGICLDEAEDKADTLLKEGQYTKEEVCQILGHTEEEFNKLYLDARTADLNTFSLQSRALHVYSEASRVLTFARTCLEYSTGDSCIASVLGDMMSESHRSCRDDYECSHPKVDELVELSKKHGAVGARMTGAGWGGCMVALVPGFKVDAFIEGMKQDYYQPLEAAKGKNLDEFIFKTLPGAGAFIIDC